MCMCMCVCHAREREKEKEGERERRYANVHRSSYKYRHVLLDAQKFKHLLNFINFIFDKMIFGIYICQISYIKS